MSADGHWSLMLETPVGERKATLTLRSNGDTFTGTQAADVGSAEVLDGRIAGNDLSWKVSVTLPFPLTVKFKATISGDAMTGTADTGWMGNFSFTGTRAQ